MAKTDISDESLYVSWKDGDKTAFDLLYERYRQPLFLFLLRRGHTQSAAEDVFHDSWMRIIDGNSKFNEQHFRGWLYTIARNLSTDLFRKLAIRTAGSLQDENIEAHHVSTQRQQEGIDCIELIKVSLQNLPLDQKDVFLLKEEAGLSLQQIADMLCVERETIKSRIRYAMKKLRDWMEDCL